ncbi:MAG: hypothetical protein HUU15_09360 [Candidatus Brocadiae bacterium]|nr:hypothetical protein [Candidatus Brocadiia bacterium]
MRKFVSAAVVFASLVFASSAFAGEPAWRFRPGQTFTYECSTEFHYVQFTRTVAGQGLTTGETTTTTEDPQWENVTFKVTVLNVGDDGAARMEFIVESVHIETRFDSSGDHADWDSKKSRETDIIGYKQYQAILGHKFEAVIAADGAIRELKNAAWPVLDVSGMKETKKNERAERAAKATHPPTPISAWLNLVFSSAPEAGGAWKRTLSIPQEEQLDARADGTETIGKYPCAKSKLKSAEKERGLKPGDVKAPANADVAKVAEAMIQAVQKKGDVWFSRQHGCLVKMELEAAAEQSGAGRSTTHATMKWGVELKSRGFTELTPGGTGEPAPVETK